MEHMIEHTVEADIRWNNWLKEYKVFLEREDAKAREANMVKK